MAARLGLGVARWWRMRRRGAAGVKKGRAGDCGGIGIPATSPVIPGGRCGAGKEGERRALTRGPGVAEGVGARSRADAAGRETGLGSRLWAGRGEWRGAGPAWGSAGPGIWVGFPGEVGLGLG